MEVTKTQNPVLVSASVVDDEFVSVTAEPKENNIEIQTDTYLDEDGFDPDDTELG